ncbi:hypothetical protein [Micromonospora sp. NPDC085948]|uniref:hypothetical protein n=1 Tax=Micromonospora sp. NPDC085948 TaxID=3155293 RepID=UPI0034452DF1
MLTVSDRLPEHGPTARVSLDATNASATISHPSHEGTWRLVLVGPMEFTSIGPTEIGV